MKLLQSSAISVYTHLHQAYWKALLTARISERLLLNSHRSRSALRGVDDIIAELRAKTTTISGIEQLNFITQEGGPPSGADVEVKVKGPRF